MNKAYYPKDCISEELEEDAPEKACVSCKFRQFDEKKQHNICLIDKHFIGYLSLWSNTCRYHELEE